jgi:predicted nucleotidyltransferase
VDSTALSSQDFALLQRLVEVQRDRRLKLEDLSDALEISPSLLVRRLQKLVAQGWVERRQEVMPRGRAVYYLPRARVSIQWISLLSGVALEWSLGDEISWDFPLVSQLPDAGARETLRRFLLGLRAGGRLDAARHSSEASIGESGEPGVTVVVYGSTARGTASKESDVDVVVFAQDAADEDEIVDVAASVSLEAPRSLQVRVVPIGALGKMPPQIRKALKQDGLVVFDGLEDASVWRLVHGGNA